MQLSDYFEATVVVGQGPAAGQSTRDRLQGLGCQSWLLDLDGPASWRDTLAEVLAHARGRGAAGALLLLPEHACDAAFWSPQDAMVEHLASRRWDIVYLGHGAGGNLGEAHDRPGLIHCDQPPGAVSAIAVSCQVLEALLAAMPERGTDGPLAPADWLEIASWLAMANVRHAAGWAAWPPLMQPMPAATTPPPSALLH